MLSFWYAPVHRQIDSHQLHKAKEKHTDGIEYQINHVVGSPSHLIVPLNHGNAVVQRIPQVRMAHGTDGNAGATQTLEIGRDNADLRCVFVRRDIAARDLAWQARGIDRL